MAERVRSDITLHRQASAACSVLRRSTQPWRRRFLRRSASECQDLGLVLTIQAQRMFVVVHVGIFHRLVLVP
jgi:hypothetical protein